MMLCKIFLVCFFLSSMAVCYGAENVKSSYRNYQINKRSADSDLLIEETSSQTKEELVIPENCKKLGICEDIGNYPEQHVQQVLEKLQQQNFTKFNNATILPALVTRMDVDSESIELCNFKEKIYAPRAAKDINNEWRVIVNDKKYPQQTFRVQICEESSSPCSPVAIFIKGYEGRCVQKYTPYRMLALNSNNEVVETSFLMPSYCSCVAIPV